jgi:hypothetical protein
VTDTADDDGMIEQRQSEAEREAQARETESVGGLVYRTVDNATPAPAEPDPVALFGDDRDDLLARAVGYALSEVRHKLRKEFRREISKLQKHLTALRRQVDSDVEHGIVVVVADAERRLAALAAENLEMKALLGDALAAFDKSNQRAEVVELPSGFLRRDDAA